MIIGSPDTGYTYYSYGNGVSKSGSSSLSNGDNLTKSMSYDTFAGALQAAQAGRSNPYDSYMEFETSNADDQTAAAYAMTWQGSDYNVLWNNCVEMVNGALHSIGIDTKGNFIPNDWQTDKTNQDLSNGVTSIDNSSGANGSSSSGSGASGGGPTPDTWTQDYSDPWDSCLYISPTWTSDDINFIQHHVYGWGE
jgi:hypothetical protein